MQIFIRFDIVVSLMMTSWYNWSLTDETVQNLLNIATFISNTNLVKTVINCNWWRCLKKDNPKKTNTENNLSAFRFYLQVNRYMIVNICTVNIYRNNLQWLYSITLQHPNNLLHKKYIGQLLVSASKGILQYHNFFSFSSTSNTSKRIGQ